jgi:release factor glutamine methyltransferase
MGDGSFAGPSTSHDALLASSGLPRSEARALLEAVTGRSRVWLAAHGDEPVEPAAAEPFLALVGRRLRGEPLAYLIGWREFHGRRFEVDARVLIPRPETELLVDLALERAASLARPRLIDLGTGSGAIAVTLALERPDADVVATDVSDGALALAARNSTELGAGGGAGVLRFCAGSWWNAVSSAERFDLAVSNPPYVAAADPHLDDAGLGYEPRASLASGPMGMDALSEIVAGACLHLADGGWLLVEHGYDQGPAVAALFEHHGFEQVSTHADAAGHPRVCIGRWRDRPVA